MEALSNIAFGLDVALSWTNLLYCFIGVFLGTLIGVLPGIGPTSTISILIPVAYQIGNPIGSLIMLAGIFYGAQYGGSITSILLKLPGEVTTIISALDGYQLAQKGRAGAALTIAAIGSFIAGTFATFVVAFAAQPLALIGFKFGPAEYTNLMILGLLMSIVLTQGSFLKGFGMILLGILLGLIGLDVNTGYERFNLGYLELADGIPFPIAAIGMFGLSEVLYNLFHDHEKHLRKKHKKITLKELIPNKEELKRSINPIFRGTFLGSFLGLVPGPGTTISGVASYVTEKKLSNQPEKFGTGEIEGLAGPESANNAAAQTSYIPFLSLGLAFSPVPVMLLGALITFNIIPGPMLMETNSDLFWGVIASMWIGNIMLLILNIPLISIWVKLLTVPWTILYPAIFVITTVGAYFISYNTWHIGILFLLAIFGYICRRLDIEVVPFIMGFVLGKFLEEYLRRALTMSSGNYDIFYASSISKTILLIIFMALVLKIYAIFRRKALTTAY